MFELEIKLRREINVRTMSELVMDEEDYFLIMTKSTTSPLFRAGEQYQPAVGRK